MDATTSTSEPIGGASPSESVAFAPPAAVPSSSKGKKPVKRVLGEEEDEDGNKKKRNRKPVTCAQCRRRKLKCDRGYPCGACRDRQEGHLCEWEGAIRLPQPHLTRDAEAQELRGQLDRFETLLAALSSGQSIGTSAAGGMNGASGSGDGDVGENGAVHLLSQLSTNTANSSAVKISNSATRAQLLAQAQSVGHLVGLLPSRKELDILVQRFVSGEPNFLPVIHVPTFQKRYNNFSHSTASEEPFFLAFLFSVVSYEMGWQLGEMSLSKTAGIQKEGAMKRLFEASSEALRMAGYLESPNLDVVRTLIILYQCASQQLDARAGYLLTQAVQVAQALGLNRDPQAAGITDQIQIQERRRLWYTLVAYDALEQPGRLSMISPEQYDTLPAASAFDHDITEASVTTRPFPSFTPSLYLNLLNDIANYNRLINQSFFSIKPKEQITWAKIVESNKGIDRLRESFSPLTWKNGLVEPLPEDQFASDKFRVLAHTALLKLDIRVNRPFLTRGFADSRFKEGRTRTLDAAHQLLGIWLAYPDQSSVSRLWQLSYHGLNALCIIIVDLLQDPKGPRADSHRKFLAMSSGRLDRPEYKSKVSLAVTRVIGILTKHLATPILPAYIASSTTLDPSEHFAVSSLPLPLTIDPFAYIPPPPPSEDRDPTLATCWHEIVASYPAMYAVPDKYEWMELSKLENRWKDGIDLLVDQSIDQLED